MPAPTRALLFGCYSGFGRIKLSLLLKSRTSPALLFPCSNVCVFHRCLDSHFQWLLLGYCVLRSVNEDKATSRIKDAYVPTIVRSWRVLSCP